MICNYFGTGKCICPPPEPRHAEPPTHATGAPKLEDLLDHAARDYREMAMGFGPVVPDFESCWKMADFLVAAAQRLRTEVEHQEKMAITGNQYSECVTHVLDRIRETT